MIRIALFHLVAVTAMLALIPPRSTTLDELSHATVVTERRADAGASPSRADMYQSVLSFGPGAWTMLHWHNGGSYNTVLAGQVTLRIGDTDRTFGPGEGWTDVPGVLHVAGNAGDGEARLLATMVVEPDVPPATMVEPEDHASAPPPPEYLAMTTATDDLPAGPLDVVQQFIDLDPSAQVTLPAATGPRLIGVVDGMVTVTGDGVSQMVEAGDGWSETMGVTYTYATGDAGARICVTTLVPRDATAAAPVDRS
ncbi:MAG: cupin domain-containing protein [Chloroflexi bacterium]|nr:cupin domain-containing protein [Chloroflexota bacterium]